MIRGTLVGLIYHRSLHVQGGKHNDGNALTLMNTDVDSLDSIGETFHKTWAQFVEVVVGIALLVRQIGWLCPVPLVIICCRFLSPSMHDYRQLMCQSLLSSESIYRQSSSD